MLVDNIVECVVTTTDRIVQLHRIAAGWLPRYEKCYTDDRGGNTSIVSCNLQVAPEQMDARDQAPAGT